MQVNNSSVQSNQTNQTDFYIFASLRCHPPAQGAGWLQTSLHATYMAFMLRCAFPDFSISQNMTSPYRYYLLLGQTWLPTSMYLLHQLFVKYI